MTRACDFVKKIPGLNYLPNQRLQSVQTERRAGFVLCGSTAIPVWFGYLQYITCHIETQSHGSVLVCVSLLLWILRAKRLYDEKKVLFVCVCTVCAVIYCECFVDLVEAAWDMVSTFRGVSCWCFLSKFKSTDIVPSNLWSSNNYCSHNRLHCVRIFE